MKSYEEQFLIMVDAEESIDGLVSTLQHALEVTSKATPRSFYWKDNWVQLSKNSDYDEALMSSDQDGFLYYPFRIEVSPINDEITTAHQVAIAKLLGQSIAQLGYRFEICADFEDLL